MQHLQKVWIWDRILDPDPDSAAHNDKFQLELCKTVFAYFKIYKRSSYEKKIKQL